MTAYERKTRFEIATEIVIKIYNDYCHDQNTTREQAQEFFYVISNMLHFESKLHQEAKKI